MAENKGTTAKAASKSAVIQEVANETNLSRKQVASVFDALGSLIRRELGKKGPGVFTIPGLLKLKVVRKKATAARKGINPFTGQETTFKAKPARNVVKAMALKNLKEMVK
jgi:nucleoid DNA-binding protein